MASPVTLNDSMFPTSRLLNPVTKVVKVELVETSRKYFVAPADACQLAVKLEFVILVAAKATGADLLWRGRKNLRLDVDKRLPDGSYLSRIYAGTSDWKRKRNGIVVRVIDYVLSLVVLAMYLQMFWVLLQHKLMYAKTLKMLLQY